MPRPLAALHLLLRRLFRARVEEAPDAESTHAGAESNPDFARMKYHILVRLASFVEEEQKAGAPGRDTNTICNALGIVSRYRQYLEIVLPRYAEAGEGLRSSIKRLDGPSRTMTPEDMDAFADMQAFSVQVQFEIEVFYMVAKTLLDRVAHAVEHYFGPARGVSVDSHDDFVKGFTAYVAGRRLTDVPDALPMLMQDLKARVSDYRDYEVSHEKSPRSLIMTTWAPGAGTMRHRTRMYPRDSEATVASEPLEKLVERIDEYLVAILDFLRANRSRRRDAAPLTRAGR